MALASNEMNMVPQMSLQGLLGQLGQQAQPQPLNPQGYRNQMANAQLGLLKELQPGGGQFDQYAQNEYDRFKQQLPMLAASTGGRGLGAFQQAQAGALEKLGTNLGSQRLGYEQNRQGMLSSLLGQQQQMGQRQQELGLQGLQGIGGLQQRIAEAPLDMQLKFLQQLMGTRSQQTAQGLGQGGETEIDPGALHMALKSAIEGLRAWKGK